jgi:hypothetical protein
MMESWKWVPVKIKSSEGKKYAIWSGGNRVCWYRR